MVEKKAHLHDAVGSFCLLLLGVFDLLSLPTGD